MTEKLPLLNAARALQIVGIAMCGSLLLAPASNNAKVDAGTSTATQVMVPKDAGP